MSMLTQEAVYQSPGACSSVVLFSAPGGGRGPRCLAQRAARLLQLVESTDADGPLHRPANLHVLVAVSNAATGGQMGTPDFHEFPAGGIGGRLRRGNGQADVLVQISAATEVDRLYGLRLAAEVIGRGYGLHEEEAIDVTRAEVHGGRLLSGLEPFGYRDGPPGAAEGFPPALAAAVRELSDGGIDERQWVSALRERGLLPGSALTNEPRLLEILKRLARTRSTLPSTLQEARERAADHVAGVNTRLQLTAEGPVWLLYQRFVHDFAAFQPTAAEAAIGKKPFQAIDEASPGPGSHLAVAKAGASALHRKGFAYRNDSGTEGLAFLALAAAPGVFGTTLTRHAEEDRLVKTLVEAPDGGVYVVPPSAAWLSARVGSAAPDSAVGPVPPIAEQLLRPRSSPVPELVAYQVAAALPAYIALARARGMFLEPTMTLRPDIEARLVLIEDALGAGNDLRALREQIRATSEAIYRLNGGYLTLGA